MKTMNPNDVIESLKQALLFYGNVDNYNKNLFHEKGLIYSDLGSQARFALSLIESYEQSEYIEDDDLKSVDDADEFRLFEDMIENLKNIKTEDND